MRQLGEAYRAVWVWHKHEHATVVRSDTCNIFERTVWIGWHLEMFRRLAFHVFERYCSVFLELCEHFGWCIVFAFPMCYWDGQSLYSLQPWALSCDLQINPATSVATR